MTATTRSRFKASGLGWAGDVPADWPVLALRRVARLESGHTPSRQAPEYWVPEECTIPWFSLADVWQLREARQTYLGETAEKISPLGVQNSAARVLPAGTVVLSRTASVGFAGIMPRPMATTQDFANWVPGPRLVPEYLLFVFRAMAPEFERLRMGSTHQTIYMPDIQAFRIPLPPVQFQQKIAAFLAHRVAALDSLIEKKRRLVALLQQKRQAFITEAVTKGLDPCAPLKDSKSDWLSSIPKHWTVMKLGYLAAIVNGSTPRRDCAAFWDGGTVPWLNSTRINDGVVREAEQFVTPTAVRECHLPLVRAGAVLVAITGEGQTRGRAALLATDATINQHLAAVVVRSRRLLAPFLWRQLQGRYDWLRAESSGGGSTRAALTCEFLRTVPIAVPPELEQAQIVGAIDGAISRLDALQAASEGGIKLLGEYRLALITAAVTGKLDLSKEAC